MSRIPKAVTVLLCCVLTFSLVGCATILKSKTTEIQVNSNPQDANVYFDGNRVGKTPLSTKVSDKDPLTVDIKKEGYEETSKKIGTHSSMGWYVADFLIFYPSVLIDAITGDAHTLNEKKLDFTLEPITTSTHK